MSGQVVIGMDAQRGRHERDYMRSVGALTDNRLGQRMWGAADVGRWIQGGMIGGAVDELPNDGTG